MDEDPDTLEYPERFEKSLEERELINLALAKELSEREKTCLLLSIVAGYKQKEIAAMIAAEWGEISPARVSQIIKDAKEKLRKSRYLADIL